MNAPKVFASLIFCGNSFHSHSPAYPIEIKTHAQKYSCNVVSFFFFFFFFFFAFGYQKFWHAKLAEAEGRARIHDKYLETITQQNLGYLSSCEVSERLDNSYNS